MARLSIVICTYERPALLAALLHSILAQEGIEDGAGLDVVVVDNSDSGSARTVVAGIAAGAAIPMAYVSAHPANISVARNAGCRASRGEAVAFLDDDQELDPGWLAAVRDGLARLHHVVLFGPIAPRFEDPGTVTPPARALFTRAGDLPAGHDLVALDRPAAQPFVLSTANSVFRRAALPGADPFDPDFGQCGGEDLHLLCRLQRAGARFGWLPEARARDFVPRHRCGAPYLVRRHFAGGQAFAAALIRTSPRPRRDGAVLALKAALQLALLPVTGLALLRHPAPGRGLAIRAAGIVGKLFWRRLYPLYRAEERARPARQAGARP